MEDYNHLGFVFTDFPSMKVVVLETFVILDINNNNDSGILAYMLFLVQESFRRKP